MKIGGGWASIARTCIGEVWVRKQDVLRPGRQAVVVDDAVGSVSGST